MASAPPPPSVPLSSPSPILEVRHLTKSYPSGEKTLEILRDISFDIYTGEILTITGQSGQGKSTLLHLLGLLDTPNTGSILFEGKDLTRFSGRKQSQYRNRIMGFIFQFYHLLPEFSAFENVLMPAMIQCGFFDWHNNKKKFQQRALELLEVVGLQDRLHHPPHKLSGGEKQRVAIARALLNQPKVIFCDEPTGNLDEMNAKLVEEYLVQVNQKFQQTFVIVTHNPSLSRLGTRQLRLKQGTLEEIQAS
jgi:lipoprotein-releasing system ATP-binding protein